MHKDPTLKKIIKDLSQNPTKLSLFQLVKGRFLHMGRVVLPAKSIWVTTLLQECHYIPTGVTSVLPAHTKDWLMSIGFG